MIGISSDQAFRRLAVALGKPQWAEDQRFRTNRDRVCHTPELDRSISEILSTHPVSHWTAVLDRRDIACDPVQAPDQVMTDRQVQALCQLESIELAGQGSALVPKLPLELSLTPAAIQGPPPAVGQHTRAILQEAGYADTEIEDLLRAGACVAAPGEPPCQP